MYEQAPFPGSSPKRNRGLRGKEGRRLTVKIWQRTARPRPRPPGRGWGRWGRGGGASPRVAAPPSPSPSPRLICPRFSRCRMPGFFPFSLSVFLCPSSEHVKRSRGQKWATSPTNTRGPSTLRSSNGPVFRAYWCSCHLPLATFFQLTFIYHHNMVW